MRLFTKSKSRTRELAAIVEEMARREGLGLLRKLLVRSRQDEAAAPLLPWRALPQSAAKTVGQWLQTPTARGKVQKLVRGALLSASSTSGFATGALIPGFDVQIKRRDKPGDHISLPRAPVFLMRLSLEWMEEVLQLAAKHPLLAETDRQRVDEIVALAHSVSQSLRLGAEFQAATLAWAGRPLAPRELFLPTSSFEQLAASLFPPQET